ncbi:MAG TPA: hypothetical protein VFB37_11295 [Steroidobacteraceae bacterium]|nr:hypothetical protein [Steroidobacteraceae bacterium]
MNFEDALNIGLHAYRVERVEHGDAVEYRATLPDYPQCTGCGGTAEEAVRTARHQLTQLRDSQAAVAVCDLEDERSDRLREAIRAVVTRALI